MPRVKLFNEKEVLQKAVTIFWKQGYNATSIQNLVDELGINRASLYDTFGGKENLFKQSFELYQQSNRKVIMDLLNSQNSIKEGFKKLLESSVAAAGSDNEFKGCFAVNTTTELLPGDPALAEVLSKNQAEVEEVYYTYLKKGQENGEISKDKNIRSIARYFFTFVNGLMVVGKLNLTKDQLFEMIEVGLSVLD